MEDIRSMVESCMASNGVVAVFVGIESFHVDGSKKDH